MGVQLVFEDYLERAKEREEKEAKKRRRLADDFTNLLRSTKVRVHGTSASFFVRMFRLLMMEYQLCKKLAAFCFERWTCTLSVQLLRC